MQASRPRSTGRPTAAPRSGPSHGEHRHRDRRRLGTAPARARRSCCPAAPTRSSTCRPTRAPRSSAPSGATPTRASRRSTSSRSAGRRRGPARARRRPQPHLRRACPTREGVDFDDSGWQALAPADTHAPPRARARVLQLVPRPASRSPSGSATSTRPARPSSSRSSIDDYAEVWVDGELPLALGDTGGQVVGGFNAPNRVVLTRDARPGETLPDRRVRHQRPDLGLAAQLHLDAHRDARLLRRASARTWRRPAAFEVERARARPRRRRRRRRARRAVAGGFEFTEGPVWTPRRRAAVQLAEHERDLPLGPERRGDRVPLQERLHRHRHRPLPPARLERPDLRPRRAADDVPARQPPRHPRRPARRHHGARRPLRGQAAEHAQRPRLPLRRHALLHRPAVRAARRSSTTRPRSCRSAASSACATARCSLVTDELAGPNGLAFSPDERYLYVGNWDLERKVVMRYDARRGRAPCARRRSSST